MKSHTHTHTHIHRIAFHNIMNWSGEHMLSKISQTEKDKHCMISLICGIWKTQWTKKTVIVSWICGYVSFIFSRKSQTNFSLLLFLPSFCLLSFWNLRNINLYENFFTHVHFFHTIFCIFPLSASACFIRDTSFCNSLLSTQLWIFLIHPLNS